MTARLDTFQVDLLARDLIASAAAAAVFADDVVAETGSAVYADAYASAPRLTGALAESTGLAVGEGGFEVGVGVDYGGFVEFGTSDTAPQPFLGPAFDAHVGAVEAELLAVAVATL